MAERLNAAVLKTAEGASPPGVQIPLPPPLGNSRRAGCCSALFVALRAVRFDRVAAVIYHTGREMLMTLAGTLRQTNLEDVLRVIDEKRRPGLLFVGNNSLSAEIYLDSGHILCIQRSGPGQSLAERMIHARLVTPQQIGHVRAMYQQQSLTTEVDLARALLQANLLSERQLSYWVADDAVELMVVLLSWSDGEYAFEEGVTPEAGRMVIPVPLREVLEEALHHIAQRRQRASAARVAVTPDLVLDFAGEAQAPGGEVRVTPEQWCFLTAIDGRMPLRAVCKTLRISPTETLRLASELLSSGVLVVRGLARDGAIREVASEEGLPLEAPPVRPPRPRQPAPPGLSGPRPIVQGRLEGRQRMSR
jgi:hypothetical protein